ncbi:hypothetical protein V8F20_000020 [Naviculisporaceae sp. PSN 640]
MGVFSGESLTMRRAVQRGSFLTTQTSGALKVRNTGVHCSWILLILVVGSFWLCTAPKKNRLHILALSLRVGTPKLRIYSARRYPLRSHCQTQEFVVLSVGCASFITKTFLPLTTQAPLRSLGHPLALFVTLDLPILTPNAAMVSEDRQRIIEANRSLRLIKNELEALLEKGVLSEDAFDSINSLLPTESSISGSRRGTTPVPPVPSASTTNTTRAAPPVSAGIANKLNNLHLDDHHADNAPPPPSYTQSTGGGPPPLPGRKQAAPPPPPPPSKPIIAHAKALYPYAATDARDCSFERDDRLAVYEYMNADWWMGKNLRTGQEGIFPKAYVEPEQAWNNNEKANNNDPYNSHVPPQTMANNSYGNNNNNGNEEGGGSKMGEHGKKFGKKLGNAAIFGAGATIGSNIVNSIF